MAAAAGLLHGGPTVPTLDGPLSVGELARRLGVVPATLRAWQRAGILAPARDRAGQRRFSAEDVRDAQLAALLRRGGTPLPRIAVVVAQVREVGGTDELAASLESWRTRLLARGRAMLNRRWRAGRPPRRAQLVNPALHLGRLDKPPSTGDLPE